MREFVTVITPTLGIRKNGLLKAISSVEAQLDSHQNFKVEHLLVTLPGVDLSFLPADKRNLRRIVETTQRGIYQAMNFGVHQIKGNYFCFLGDDDWLLEGSLHKRFEAISGSDMDFVYSDALYVDGEKNRVLLATENPQSDWYKDLLKIQHATFMFNKEKVEQLGDYKATLFGLKLGICSDYEWFARAFTSGAKFKKVSGELVAIGAGGVSSTRAIRTFIEAAVIAIIRTNLTQKPIAIRSWLSQGLRRGYRMVRHAKG